MYRSFGRAAWLALLVLGCSESYRERELLSDTRPVRPSSGGAGSSAAGASDPAGDDPTGDAGSAPASNPIDASVPGQAPADAGACDAGCQPEVCGDGRLGPGEACDDANTLDLDGCSASCVLERCGDGVLNQAPGVEQCDDGNETVGDGCDTTCQLDSCGDGQLEPGEDCEPPSVGRCDATCRAVRIECGNGRREEAEECDDGNVAFGDGCSPSCLIERCDNGRVEAPFETCEPPRSSVCGTSCRAPLCGDGRADTAAGEECEDGNLLAGDGCNPNCRLEACGNGVLDVGEECEPPGLNGCTSNCRTVSGQAPPSVAGPSDAQEFLVQNSSFAGSLEPWDVDVAVPSSVLLGSLDVGSAPNSASAQVSLSADSPNATLWQCVRTASGAEYRLSAATRGIGPSAALVPVELGVSFYEEEDCSGDIFDGVRTYNVPQQNGRWSSWTLPPPSPVANVESTFEAPEGAGSMLVWVYLEQEAADGPTSVLVDDLLLVRASPGSCGDGIPESPEQCEPSVTPGCLGSCQLPSVCGDGIEAPGECASCPQDCSGSSPVCGDRLVSFPEQCEPPGVGACRADCSWGSSVCGNGRKEGSETCDPPNGSTCSADCRAMACGDRRVDAPEQCDPPGTALCSSHCRLLADQPNDCGNGVLEGAEQCDPPNPGTWCSRSCQRRNPLLACGDGAIDPDVGEQCDPPGPANNCSADCKLAVCGNGRVEGAEECDPANGTTCTAGCKLAGEALACQQCLGERCGPPALEQDLFAGCFELDGFAQAGPGQNAPLEQLCAEVVECMRATGCATEVRTAEGPDPAACYCGKSVLTASPVTALRACRDGLSEANGACKAVFERAAESVLPSSVLAAIVEAQSFKNALTSAVRLMQECGHAPSACQAPCSIVGACGNGVVEPGELCEPCPPGKTCAAGQNQYCAPGVCAVLPCGNGVVDTSWPYGQAEDPDPLLRAYQQPPDWLPETCDVLDPFTNQDGKCDSECHLIVTCGDGEVNPSAEACDPGGPNQDWSACCQPNDPRYNGTSQLSSCDRNRNGRIDLTEQCQIPAVCGNGKREGTEECDLLPADPSKCLDCRAVDPCAECTRAKCPTSQQQCFEAPVAATRVGCAEVLECYDQSCRANPKFLSCMCGDRDIVQDQCGNLGPNGPCAEIMARNAPCGTFPNWDFSCVFSRASDPAVGMGAAFQVFNCRKDNCAAECDYYKPVIVDE
ncbi:MAG TPA: DUF4215 domain-containing protein [Polyangiaceae bacterium]|nr:DUF4215 domain-containing protein [Polyangiaceae bacterium]